MGSVQRNSAFNGAEFIPPDSIFDVTKRYLADTNPRKVNLGQGTYRDENGKPWILPSVQLAKQKIVDCGHEYLPIAGLKEFREEAVKLVFHETKALEEQRVNSANVLGSLWFADMHTGCILSVTVGNGCATSCGTRSAKGEP